MSIQASVHASRDTLTVDIHEQALGNLCVGISLTREGRYTGGVDVFCTPAQAASILVALAGDERVRRDLKPAQRIYVMSKLSQVAVVAS